MTTPFLSLTFPTPSIWSGASSPTSSAATAPSPPPWTTSVKANPEASASFFNSFAEIESALADLYFKVDRKRSWFVGPVALASANAGDLAARGGDDPAAAANRERCLSWLGTKKPKSVVYVCFGSWSHFSGEQLKDMALGLKLAWHPFVWVVREAAGEGWMPEGFERLLEGRGPVIRGWAP
ncbi:scopoletin glucosyltransferase-like [Phoenix dactylifera]|uniref:Scopoletin glucosyltransferase-like n=1 Tax=Phoenix dactylifera TaxID=42345 RepID=A0A8B9AQG7_PHODC|nr:scopoletin glucosyltransferase-like [Phoenix dactylifera]